MLEGGLPLWVSEGYKLDEAPVSDEDLDSTMRAAQHPPSHVKYEAQLQVKHMQASSMPYRMLLVPRPYVIHSWTPTEWLHGSFYL